MNNAEYMKPFLRAIVENPLDDIPRLITADWLMEHGDPHGEFISVQCQLAKIYGAMRNLPDRDAIPSHTCTICGALWQVWPPDSRWSLCTPTCGPCCNNVPMSKHIIPLSEEGIRLLRRENELLQKYQGTWTISMLMDIPDLECYLLLQIAARDTTSLEGPWPSDACMFRFRHGFIDTIAMSHDEFLRYAGVLFQAAPITRVILTDRQPDEYTVPNYPFTWWVEREEEDSDDPAALDGRLFFRLAALVEEEGRPFNRDYKTAALALDDLSFACVEYGRDAAGLPVLLPRQDYRIYL